MLHTLTIFQTEDFDAWKGHYLAGLPARVAAGAKGHTIYRGADNPNQVVLDMAWADKGQMDAFLDQMRAGGRLPPGHTLLVVERADEQIY